MSGKVSQSTLRAGTPMISLLLIVLTLLVFSGSSVGSSAVRLLLPLFGAILVDAPSGLVATVVEHMLIGR